ncbi:MAG: DUF4143 domain-containing protein [Candidatus Thiothrix moscowensis]|nr:DUF4143 domain-containing protein [Candidatus Thiothrix moscowensis]
MAKTPCTTIWNKPTRVTCCRWLTNYDPSLVRRELGDKKAYIVDNGLISALSWRAGQDKGKLLENLAAMELRKQGLDLLFIKGTQECDFVVQQPNGAWLPV